MAKKTQEEQIKDLKGKVKDLKQKLANERAVTEGQRNDYHRISAQNSDLRKQVREAKQENTELQEKIDTLERDIKLFEKGRDDAMNKIIKLEKRVEGIREEKSDYRQLILDIVSRISK